MPHDEKECLILGRNIPRVGASPYRVCLTNNQEQRLFAGIKQKKLGCGAFACVYESSDPDRVVKFTRDPEDVAALLKAQKSGLVPKVYETYRLKQGGRTIPPEDPITLRRHEAKDTPVYALVVEKLRTLSPDERFEADRRLYFTRSVAEGTLTPERYCQVLAETTREGCSDLERQVAEAADKLRQEGIVWGDIHSGNIGFDKAGKLKVLDLGFTKTELKRRIKVLEGRRSRPLKFRLV